MATVQVDEHLVSRQRRPELAHRKPGLARQPQPLPAAKQHHVGTARDQQRKQLVQAPHGGDIGRCADLALENFYPGDIGHAVAGQVAPVLHPHIRADGKGDKLEIEHLLGHLLGHLHEVGVVLLEAGGAEHVAVFYARVGIGQRAFNRQPEHGCVDLDAAEHRLCKRIEKADMSGRGGQRRKRTGGQCEPLARGERPAGRKGSASRGGSRCWLAPRQPPGTWR